MAAGAVIASPLIVHFLADDGVVGRVVTVTTTTILVGSFYLNFRHTTGPLCEKCFERLPANASELANGKMRPFLKAYHKTLNSIPKMIVLWVIIGVIILLKGLLTDIHTLPYLAIDVFVNLMLAGTLIINRVHSKYLPWCPWCKNDGDGDGITTSDPDPSEKLPA